MNPLKNVSIEKLSMIRAFRSRNYRLFYMGQGVSSLGSWIQIVASGWLMYKLTQSSLYLGASHFASNIPIFLIAPFAGAIIDIHGSQRIIRITQFLLMLITGTLAFIVLFGKVEPWHLITANLAMGTVLAFDIPGRHSFLYDVLEYKEDLTNAVALNSIMFNIGRMAGPAIAGFLIGAYGEGFCFLFNAISFTGVLLPLFLIKTIPNTTKKEDNGVLKNLKEGLLYVKNNTPIKKTLMFIFGVSLNTIPIMVLMPVFAKDILKGGPETLGFLTGAFGTGALLAAIYLASRKNADGFDKLIFYAAMGYGFAIILFVFSALNHCMYLCFLLATTGGGFMILMFSGCNTIIQTIVSKEKRGRVMSLYSTAFVGAAPIGSVLTGYIASKTGAPLTCQIGGSICILLGMILLIQDKTLGEALKTNKQKYSHEQTDENFI